MEPAIRNGGRRAGWTKQENDLLWETAAEALEQGYPLKRVFEQIARETGRQPNSIRNYYYAQAPLQGQGHGRAARFVPFTEEEIRTMLRELFTRRATGLSVRASLQQMSGGNHSLMLRYQNKYRAVLKSRPEYVRAIVEELRAEGVDAQTPDKERRAPRAKLDEVCGRLCDGARRQADDELAHACEVLTRALFSPKPDAGVKLDLYRMALDDKQREIEGLRRDLAALREAAAGYLDAPESERAASEAALRACVAADFGGMMTEDEAQ